MATADRTNPQMYIPAEDLYFRLVSTYTNYKLFSRNSPDPQVWHFDGSDYDDQLFSLIYGTSSNKRDGQYAIKGKLSGKVLFSRSADPRVGHIAGDGSYNDK